MVSVENLNHIFENLSGNLRFPQINNLFFFGGGGFWTFAPKIVIFNCFDFFFSEPLKGDQKNCVSEIGQQLACIGYLEILVSALLRHTLPNFYVFMARIYQGTMLLWAKYFVKFLSEFLSNFYACPTLLSGILFSFQQLWIFWKLLVYRFADFIAPSSNSKFSQTGLGGFLSSSGLFFKRAKLQMLFYGVKPKNPKENLRFEKFLRRV